MKKMIAFLAILTVSSMANAVIPRDTEISCADFKGKVQRNGWAQLFLGDASKYHPTTFVSSGNNCFDQDQDAYRVRISVGGEQCTLELCFDDAHEASIWDWQHD